MKKFCIIIIVTLALLPGCNWKQEAEKTGSAENTEMDDLIALQEENLENLRNESLELLYQTDSYQINTNFRNDSLLYLLDSEKTKVKRLLEELNNVKNVNAQNLRRIIELQKELQTLRSVMRSYIVQIDSLNALNQQLKKENQEVTQKYHQASQTVSALSQEKEHLTERVNLASKLNATGISVTPVNKNGKKEKKTDKIQQLNICFTISKNVTAPTGEKNIYVRIMKPDDDVLVKNRNNVFTYENREISYSIKKVIEYEGEDISVCVYWAVEEFLYPGSYRADIFADGNLIGRQGFTLEK